MCEQINPNPCPACETGILYLLGKLGKIFHYRCLNCGIDVSSETEPIKEEDAF